MDFIDLKAQQARLKADIDRRISSVLNHGQYIMGPEIKELEKALADYVGVKHCIVCSSGTDALLMALMAYGVGKGDAIIVPSFTFVATAEVVSLTGATPVFIDIDKDTYNLNPEKLEGLIESSNSAGLKVRGIITVDLFGLPADYGQIEKIAKENALFVIEDACQGFGGEYEGKKLCSFGEVAATSFFPAKPLGCYGDGGAVFTDNDEIIETIDSLRIHGKGKDQYDNVRVGINGRMDTIQAAILLSKLSIFDEELANRRRIAEKYSEGLQDVVKVPYIPANMESGWAQYSIQSEKREEIREGLKKEGIPTAVYYPTPLHLQTAYKYLGYKNGDLLVSEEVAGRIFSLPMHPYLKDADIERVINAIKASL